MISNELKFGFSESGNSYLGFGQTSELMITSNDLLIQNPWERIDDFLKRNYLENIFGYIGFDVSYYPESPGFTSNFPVVHLIAPSNLAEKKYTNNSENTLDLNDFEIGNSSSEQYMRGVQDCLNWVNNHSSRKITLARKIDLEGSFNLFETFKLGSASNLLSFYYSNGDLEFVGNSPEKTLEGNIFNRRFRLQKASGTFERSYDPFQDLELRNRFSNDSKNQFEHQIGVEQIKSKLDSLNARTETRFEIVDFSRLRHMRTNFDFTFEQVPNLTDLLELSFTSGVTDKSGLEVISRNEKFSRGPYYGIFFSKLKSGEIKVYHLLRAIFRNRNKFYSICGAGITRDSTPEGELEETKLKLSNILAVS